MRAGDLRWTAAVQQQDLNSLTTSGQPDPNAWSTLFTRRVQIEEITGTKNVDGANQRQATAWFHVTMRRTITVLPSHRLVITGSPFDGLVMFITNTHSDLQTTRLTCCIRGNR